MAQWKRAGPITQRSVDRNYALLKTFTLYISSKTVDKITHGETRTRNLRFRRPTPYPLGHAGLTSINFNKIDFISLLVIIIYLAK